jgi:hypothetical protein
LGFAFHYLCGRSRGLNCNELTSTRCDRAKINAASISCPNSHHA